MARLRFIVGVIGLTLLASESADAQLFPNMWIRRQRPDCDNESPMIKMNRDFYYGYHPTEWKRFPEGWGISSPEVINKEELMAQIKKEIKRLDEEFGPPSRDNRGGDEDIPQRGGGDRNAEPGNAIPRPVPLPNQESSPFNLDAKPATPAIPPSRPSTSAAGGAAQPGTTPPATPSLPKPGDSPFDLPPDRPGTKPAEEVPPRPRAAAPRTGSADLLDSSEVAAVEAPGEVMRAPQRNVVRDTLSSLNPLGWIRR